MFTGSPTQHVIRPERARDQRRALFRDLDALEKAGKGRRRRFEHSGAVSYTGSLTTPPFTEGVRWIVRAQPITLSRHQIDAFRELFEEGNSREVQPLNGRKVFSDARRHHDGRH